jgi:bacteriorhodopsin
MNTWLWIGTCGMSLGALAFLILGRTAQGEGRDFVLITFFIAAVAATAYLAMALDQGIVTIDGREVFYARYLDWLITTPLLLLDLAILVGAGRRLIAWLIGLDIYMIGTGLIAGLTAGNERYIWFSVSSLAFIAIVGILLRQFVAMARQKGPDVARTFTRLAGLTIVLWSLYPIIWILGTEGTSTVSLTTEVAMFAIIDLLAKIGFGLVLLTSRSALRRAGVPAGNEVAGTVPSAM